MIRQQHGLILEIYHCVDVFLKSFSSVRSLSTKLLTLLRLPEPFRCRDFHRNRKSNDVRFLICHCLELKKPESERFVILVSWFLNRWLFLWQPNFLQCCFFHRNWELKQLDFSDFTVNLAILFHFTWNRTSFLPQKIWHSYFLRNPDRFLVRVSRAPAESGTKKGIHFSIFLNRKAAEAGHAGCSMSAHGVSSACSLWFNMVPVLVAIPSSRCWLLLYSCCWLHFSYHI